MARTLEFYQIYYKDDQLDKLYPFATPYRNGSLTSIFENSVIAELVPKATSELVSICSWRLREKRGGGPSEIILQRQRTFELTLENITEKDYEIAILTPHAKSHKPLAMASNWHGQAWDEAFAVLKKFLRSDIGITVPDELSNTIYENHFITTKEIYSAYVAKCLVPAIDFISTREVFQADSGYVQKLIRDPERIKSYKELTGRNDYPIAPFILERLFSIFIEGKGYKIINL